MVKEVSHTTKCGSNGAGERLSIGCMSHLFTFDAVLLCGESQGDVCGGEELRERCVEDIEEVHGANFKFYIFETEGMFRVSSGVGVFARP